MASSGVRSNINSLCGGWIVRGTLLSVECGLGRQFLFALWFAQWSRTRRFENQARLSASYLWRLLWWSIWFGGD